MSNNNNGATAPRELPEIGHVIELKKRNHTNTAGARVVLTSHRFERDTVARQYDYEGILEQGLELLRANGYTVLTYGEAKGAASYIITVREIEPLKEAFKTAGGAVALIEARKKRNS